MLLKFIITKFGQQVAQQKTSSRKKTKSPGHIHHRTWTSAVVPCHTWDILGYPLASTSDLPGKRWVDHPVSIWIFLSSESKKATLFRVRDSRAWQHSFQWIRGNVFSVYFLSFFCWCLFQSLPSSTSSSIRGREPSRRSTSRWVWRLSRRWRSSCQMKWSTPEPAFGRWETLKAFSVYLTKSWSGKHDEKNNERQLASLLVALE